MPLAVSDPSRKKTDWARWTFCVVLPFLAFFVGCLCGINVAWNEFLALRLIELLQWLSSASIAVLAVTFLSRRNSRDAKRRDVFFGILEQFQHQLGECERIGIEFYGQSYPYRPQQLISASNRLDRHGKLVQRHAGRFVTCPFCDAFDRDLYALRHILTGVPFASDTVSFPDDWLTKVADCYENLRRRAFNYQLEMYD